MKEKSKTEEKGEEVEEEGEEEEVKVEESWHLKTEATLPQIVSMSYV